MRTKSKRSKAAPSGGAHPRRGAKTPKTYRLDANTIAAAQEILGVATATEAIETALRMEQEGSSSRAVDTLKKALELDATNPRLHATIGGIILRGGLELREARAHVQRAIQLGDKSGKTRLLSGEILLRLGQKKQAREEIEAAIALGEGGRAQALLKEC